MTYTCDVGYTLQGSNSRTCQFNGQWSGSVPQCICKLTIFLHCVCVLISLFLFQYVQLHVLAPVRMVVTVQELKPALASQDGQECCVKQVHAAFLQTSSCTLNVICESMFNDKISCSIIHQLFLLVQTACTKFHCVCWVSTFEYWWFSGRLISCMTSGSITYLATPSL